MKSATAAATFAFAVAAVGSKAHAACPSVRGSMSERGATLSGQWLYEARLREAHRARTWRYAWTGINGGLAVGSFALMPFVSRDRRIELAVGGVESTIGAALTWFLPFEVEATLDRRSQASNVCAGLRIEEELTQNAAEEEIARRQWPWHLLNFGAGAAYTAIVGVTTDNWVNAAVDGVVTFAVAETQLFTQPIHLSRQYDAYRRAPLHAAWQPFPIVARETFAIGIRGVF
jgi:hypothetical protein